MFMSEFKNVWMEKKIYTLSTRCFCSSATSICITSSRNFCHTTHESRDSITDTCKYTAWFLSVWHWSQGNASEVWRVWWDHGLSPAITPQSGLVLIFPWKRLGWKWCRKQQVAHQATQANPGALECVHFHAFINTNTLRCLAGPCTLSVAPLVCSKEA